MKTTQISEQSQKMIDDHLKQACQIAAKEGQLHILKWLCKCDIRPHCDCETEVKCKGCTLYENNHDMIDLIAAEFGHIHILKWRRDFKGIMNDIFSPTPVQKTKLCAAAAKGNQLEIIKLLSEVHDHEDDSPYQTLLQKNDTTICAGAAEGGHLDLLMWLRDQGYQWDENACFNAAKNGHLKVLKWLHAQKCDQHLIETNDLNKSMCDIIARSGRIGIASWAFKNGYKKYSSMYSEAAKYGRFELIKWASRKKFPRDTNACASAALSGNFEILRWLHEFGYPWDAYTYACAARNGHFDIIKWAHKKNCPTNGHNISSTYVCELAAINGNINIMHWLHYEGFEWNENVCTNAAIMGHFKLLLWLIQRGCPCNAIECYQEINDEIDCKTIEGKKMLLWLKNKFHL